MRKHHLITAIFIAIALVACSMPYIENVPDWMHGTWDMFTEDGEYIGKCEIDEYSISVTIDSYTYETFDLLENTIQNGGWTETNENMYIIYLEPIDYNCIRFSKTNESTIEMEFVQSNVIETIFTLRNSN